MRVIQWTQDLATGVAEIDGQHKEIFQRVNALLEAAGKGKGRGEIAQVMSFLGDYVGVHFGLEEKYMGQYGYPDAPAHKAQHAEFVKEFKRLSQEFATEGATSVLLIRVERWLVDWLLQHIKRTDRALGQFLAPKMKT